jgi:hypothetical protein
MSKHETMREVHAPMTYRVSELYNLPELMGVENAVKKMERAMKRDRDLEIKRAARSN